MRIISIGDLVTDYYYIESKLYGVDGGMSSHNIIANLSKMGMNTSVIGVCGNDSKGLISIKSLKDLKVDTENIEIINDLHTRSFHINMTKDGFTSKKRCPICNEKDWYEDSKLEFNKIKKIIEKDDYIVIDNFNKTNLEVINKLKNKIFLDLGQYFELENKTDEEVINIFNREFEIINLNERVENYLKERFKRNILNSKLIIITRGIKGADFIYKGKTIKKDLSPTKEIDSNGAGDAFFASIIYDYLNNEFNIDTKTIILLPNSLLVFAR